MLHLEGFTCKLNKCEVNVGILFHLWNFPIVPCYPSGHRCAPTVLSILQQFCKTAKLKRHEANNLRFLKLKCHLLGEMGFGVEFSPSCWSDILFNLIWYPDAAIGFRSDIKQIKKMLLLLSDIYIKRENIRSNAKKISPEKKKNLFQCFFPLQPRPYLIYDLTQRICLKEQHFLNANFGEYFLSK